MAIGLDESTRSMTGWQAVVEALRAEGVPYVFGLPGDPGHLYDAVYELEQDGGPKAVGVRYETSGAFLAMAYQRVSGQLAACFGCPGSRYCQSRSWGAGSLFRLHPDAGARRARQPANQRHGRVSGNRPYRHDAADHQMGHDDRGSRADPLDHSTRGPARADGQTRSGVHRAPGRHRHGNLRHPPISQSQFGHAPGTERRRSLARRRSPCRGETAAYHHRRWVLSLRRRRRGVRAFGTIRHSGANDPVRPRIGSRDASVLLRGGRALSHQLSASYLRIGRSDRDGRHAHGRIPGRLFRSWHREAGDPDRNRRFRDRTQLAAGCRVAIRCPAGDRSVGRGFAGPRIAQIRCLGNGSQRGP